MTIMNPNWTPAESTTRQSNSFWRLSSDTRRTSCWNFMHEWMLLDGIWPMDGFVNSTIYRQAL
jgi:hypothetical protein